MGGDSERRNVSHSFLPLFFPFFQNDHLCQKFGVDPLIFDCISYHHPFDSYLGSQSHKNEHRYSSRTYLNPSSPHLHHRPLQPPPPHSIRLNSTPSYRMITTLTNRNILQGSLLRRRSLFLPIHSLPLYLRSLLLPLLLYQAQLRHHYWTMIPKKGKIRHLLQMERV